MNRERAKELLPIIQAFAEGKTVQAKKLAGEGWIDINNFIDFFDADEREWRIKPEPREFWLIEHQDGSISFKQIHIPAPRGSIKVREVIDEP